MKKLAMYALTFMMLWVCMPATVSASTGGTPISTPDPKTTDAARAETLHAKLDEINNMDKSNLSSAEKKQLRKETRSIKKELKDIRGGVYLSGGAVILIVVLLIILL